MSHSTTKQPTYLKYVFGGGAGMVATCFVQPLDLIKNRLQLQVAAKGDAKEYKNAFDAFTKIARNEGVFALYNGLGAGLLRQATYTTTRLGVFNTITDMYKTKYNTQPSVWASMAMGIVAGGSGAFVGTPAEVCLIRMTADGRLPIEQRRNYTSVFNALYRITKEEGLLTLWRGAGPTIGRAMIVNMTQLASYAQAKIHIKNMFNMQDGIPLHFWASMFSGLLTTIASMPIDIAKTRVQNMKIGPDGVPEYKGSVDVLVKVVRNEGFFSLWKGFLPYYCRLGPHTVLTFIVLEQLNRLYNVLTEKK